MSHFVLSYPLGVWKKKERICVYIVQSKREEFCRLNLGPLSRTMAQLNVFMGNVENTLHCALFSTAERNLISIPSPSFLPYPAVWLIVVLFCSPEIGELQGVMETEWHHTKRFLGVSRQTDHMAHEMAEDAPLGSAHIYYSSTPLARGREDDLRRHIALQTRLYI